MKYLVILLLLGACVSKNEKQRFRELEKANIEANKTTIEIERITLGDALKRCDTIQIKKSQSFIDSIEIVNAVLFAELSRSLQ